MASPEYYNTLGVSKSASADEIRKAYKKLAREYHPDVQPGDERAAQKFKEIQEAYSVLSDEQKRQKYDQFGHAAFQGTGGNPFGHGGASFDLNDILGDMFGGGFGGFGGAGHGFGGQRRQQPRKGQDVSAEIHIPFNVAATGGSHDLQLTRGGKLERLTVKVPAGVNSGSVIRLRGQGNPGAANGPDGDLLVTIQVASHPWFRRDGSHLTIDVPITPTEAALGARVEVPTLNEGPVVVTVPAGTSSGAKLRLREKGIIDQKTGQRGDLFVQIKIEIPRELSHKATELFRNLEQAAPQSPREGLW